MTKEELKDWKRIIDTPPVADTGIIYCCVGNECEGFFYLKHDIDDGKLYWVTYEESVQWKYDFFTWYKEFVFPKQGDLEK